MTIFCQFGRSSRTDFWLYLKVGKSFFIGFVSKSMSKMLWKYFETILKQCIYSLFKVILSECEPWEVNAFVIFVISVKTVWISPAKVPLSKYQQLNSLLQFLIISWIPKENRTGPSGSGVYDFPSKSETRYIRVALRNKIIHLWKLGFD